MPDEPVIRVENLGKCYNIRHNLEKGTGLRHVIQDLAFTPFRFMSRGQLPWQSRELIKPVSAHSSGHRAPIEKFWALRDLSFEINRGDVVGIIGRNGAGKSTLLKILSRITEPTAGRIEIDGRVSSLLEVGTGFHPELTGRENIFLNGAILGMKRAEIRAKFDAIVDFSGVEKFLDTPVKRYSSGMYVRLAFAVAAHLEPEILVVDEVLAVGDIDFQKKCIGKMKDVATSGRTVLFVSHNLSAVTALCNRVVYLAKGSLVGDGSPQEMSRLYLSDRPAVGSTVSFAARSDAPGNDRIRITSVAVVGEEGETNLRTCNVVKLKIGFEVLQPGLSPSAFVIVTDACGGEIFCSPNLPSAIIGTDPLPDSQIGPGIYLSVCEIPENFLNERTYGVKVGFNTAGSHCEFVTEELVSFAMARSDAMRSEFHGEWPGIVRPKLRWETRRVVNQTNRC